MNNNIIVGITGTKGSGKDTVGQMLHQHFYSYHPHRLAFADSVKAEIAEATGGSIETINNNKHRPEVRRLLQWWGTELRREEYGKEYWIKKAEEKLQEICSKPTKHFIYITDCRFPNEAAFLKQHNATLIRIFRPEADAIKDGHASETNVSLLHWDHSIQNNGSLSDLAREVKYVAEFIKTKYGI